MRYLITGGTGFLGKHIQEKIKDYSVVIGSEVDLRILDNCLEVIDQIRPDIIINLAANVGGIMYNSNHPYETYYDNILIGTNMIHASVLFRDKIEKFVQIGTICSYPKFSPIPFSERNIYDGYPEETNAPYGIAKLATLTHIQAARKQYNLNAIYLMPTNMYGPYDNFEDNKSHVIPALIKKFFNAIIEDKEFVEIWGTGDASRDFLYVEDAAEIILKLSKTYSKYDPLNIGPGIETRISVLVDLIKTATGYQGKVKYDEGKPDGQPRRCVSNRELIYNLESYGFTKLKDGIHKTVEWYRQL